MSSKGIGQGENERRREGGNGRIIRKKRKEGMVKGREGEKED